jgi:hydrogenase maturation protein HypF
MVEHTINEQVIGVALDGSGYGPDGTVWGGEFLITDVSRYRRVAHFKQYRMPGSEEAIKNPIRMALSYLITDFDLASNPFYNNLLKAIPKVELDILHQMITSGFRSPLTSSCGRLFDAVAALLGICDTISYEGQAAIRLQNIAKQGINDVYPFDIAKEEGLKVISFTPMIQEIITDLKSGKDNAIISAMFHNTVAASVAEICKHIRSENKITKAVLSGGVFQNDLLLKLTKNNLQKADFEVYSHEKVPPNDGGIALGQAAIAIAKFGYG